MKKVIHFLRKSTQLKASFIQNQILNHIEYQPFVIFKINSLKDDGGFALFHYDDLKTLDLSKDDEVFGRLVFKIFKKISPRNVNSIKKFINDVKPDILHFHYGTDAGIYSPFTSQTDIPKVVSFYGYECSGFPRRFGGLGQYYLKKRVYKYIDKVFAMSPDMKRDIVATGCPYDKVVVHYYGTDVDRFNMAKEHKASEMITFLIISGLEPQKGHMFLLKAFYEAYQKNKKIRLKIIGTGALEEKLKAFIKENQMDFVELLGKVVYASNEHLKELQNADVFVHPSVTDVNGDKEGIPGAVIEAMAAGLPVISTYHAGIPFVIESGVTGLLVNEWDVPALTEKILLLASDPGKREELGENARTYAFQNLRLKDKELQLEALYNSMLLN